MTAREQLTTVIDKEVNHFNGLITDWESTLAILIEMNAVRLPFVQKGLINSGKVSAANVASAKPLSGLKILDVGCGVGILSRPLVQAGAIVTGLDAACEMIKTAQLIGNDKNEFKNNLNYVCDTIENFCDNNVAQYDAIVASETVEHVASVDLFLKCCIKTLKPGGSIFITTINRTIWSWLKAIIFYEYITGHIPKGSHEWHKFISPQELEAILQQYNCQVHLVSGNQYNIFKREWSLSDDVSTFYLLHAVKDD